MKTILPILWTSYLLLASINALDLKNTTDAEIGCFLRTSITSRTLEEASFSSPNLTVASCIEFCSGKQAVNNIKVSTDGHLFAGLQYPHCTCFDKYPLSNMVQDSLCNET